MAAKMSQKQMVLRELLETEKSYVRDLEIMLEFYEKPLIKSKMIKKEKIDLLFVNTEEILTINRSLLGEFQAIYGQNPDYNVSIPKLAHAFVTLSKEMVSPYKKFCGKHDETLLVYNKLMKKNSKFADFVKVQHDIPEVNHLMLNSYMVKPIQRLCKYPLLIRELIKETEDQNEPPTLDAAMDAMEKFGQAINLNKQYIDTQNLLESTLTKDMFKKKNKMTGVSHMSASAMISSGLSSIASGVGIGGDKEKKLSRTLSRKSMGAGTMGYSSEDINKVALSGLALTEGQLKSAKSSSDDKEKTRRMTVGPSRSTASASENSGLRNYDLSTGTINGRSSTMRPEVSSSLFQTPTPSLSPTPTPPSPSPSLTPSPSTSTSSTVTSSSPGLRKFSAPQVPLNLLRPVTRSASPCVRPSENDGANSPSGSATLGSRPRPLPPSLTTSNSSNTTDPNSTSGVASSTLKPFNSTNTTGANSISNNAAAGSRPLLPRAASQFARSTPSFDDPPPRSPGSLRPLPPVSPGHKKASALADSPAAAGLPPSPNRRPLPTPIVK
eukprot:TRINITY_DN10973_c0_g1_i1.p1 TRINITY_DN10973_c0_g1~~TRINITY_DN10973_c0_g1_i1.p1  ORF type:complete len:552 (+),score=97.38 TRINITY_DN10973_c0_g1_i1:76-1731(+)